MIIGLFVFCASTLSSGIFGWKRERFRGNVYPFVYPVSRRVNRNANLLHNTCNLMTINVNAIFRKDKIKSNNTAPIHIRFTLNRKIRYVSTGVTIHISKWDFENQRIKDNSPEMQELQYRIDTKLNEYRRKIKRLEALEVEVTLDNLLETNGRKINCTVGEYLKQTIERLETLGKYGSASKHRSLLSRLSEFRSLNIRFDEIDLAYLRDFELFLRKEGNTTNSIATKYAILQCLYIRCHVGLCPLFRTPSESTQKLPDHMVRQLLNSNVVVLENPQQRTGKRGAHFGSVPHLFGNGSSRIDALLGLIGLADHRQRFSVSAQLKGVAGAPRLTVAVTARKLRTVDRKIAGIAHKGRSFHLLEDVERPVGQELDVDIEIRICLVAPLRLAPLAHNARINVFRTVVILRTTG